MFKLLGRLACRFPALIVTLGVLVVVLGAGYGRDAMQHLSLSFGWDVPGSGSALATERLRERMGVDETAVLVLFNAKAGQPADVDDPAYRAAAEEALAGIASNPEVRSVLSYYYNGDDRLRSKDGRSTYAVVQLARGADEGGGAFERLREQLHSPSLKIELGGELATYAETRQQLEKDLRTAELISFVSLAVLLVWVFGSPVAALLPLIVGGVTVVLSLALLKLVTQFTDVTVFTANVVSMLGLGLSIDYSLFIVSRFREELRRCDVIRDCLCATLVTAGRTVAYSGMTVGASLLCLLLLPQHFFQNMGLAGAIAVGVAMTASVLILPALLMLIGRRIDRFALPGLIKHAARREEGTGWYRFSHFVMRHARLVLFGTLALLLILGLPIQHMQVGLADHKSLPVGAESRRVLETVQSAFPSAGLDPLVVVLRAKGQAGDAATIAGLDGLTRQIESLPGVLQVAGMTSLDEGFTAEDYQLIYQNPDQFPLAAQALENFARGDHLRLYVFYEAPPQSDEAHQLVEQIRAIEMPEGVAEMYVGGFPAFHLDYLDSLREWVPWTIGAIVMVIFVLLFLMLGSLLVPLKVVLTNILSLSATYGGLVLIFQDGYLAGLLGFTPPGALDGTVLVLIFASAFGLSIDYEVFLLSRVKEVCDATGDNMTAVSTGIQRSGPIITNAALLIAIVLGAFALGEVVFMKQIGLGLLLAVVVDTTIVRMLLVPATLRLLGNKNWWAPRPLMLVYERFNFGETGSHYDAPIRAAQENKA